MTQVADIRSQFNAGEFSPLVEGGRIDFAKYANGCRTLENFIPTVQGPIKRRQGSRYVATTALADKRVWLLPFKASNQEQYVLEFGPGYVRFYTNHGQLLNGSGFPYELATPYSSENLTTNEGTCNLQLAQSNDVLYIACGAYAPAKLSRIGVGTFTFTEDAVGVTQFGPFKELNSDESAYVSASDDEGSITLTATTGIFLDGMVGKYFYMEEGTKILVHQWEFNKDIITESASESAPYSESDIRRRSNGINYITVADGDYDGGGLTGSNKPTHLQGTRWDGNQGVAWTFTDDGSGVVRIDSLVGAQPTNIVNATVIKRLPFSITSSPGGSTHRWAATAWNDNDGFPESVCFFRERTVWARGQQLWMSVAGDFENFATRDGGQVVADSAIIMTIASDKKDSIQWLQPESSLVCGTASGEYAIAEYSNGSPLGPANIRAQRQSAFGSRAIKPITVGAAVLYVEKGGRRVREMSFDIRQSQYISVDVSVLSEHITKSTGLSPSQRINDLDGITDWTFAQRPDHVLWAARADGVLLGLTYNREQDVTAWHRHKIGYQLEDGLGWGLVESVCAIGSPDGTQDDLWLVVNRGGMRHIEYIGQPVQTEVMNTVWGGAEPYGIANKLGLSAAELASTQLWELDAYYVDGGLSRVPTIVYAPAQTVKQIFLTSGDTWTVPADWNREINTVECFGAGGDGESANLAGGGGGGAYSRKANLALSGNIRYQVGTDLDTYFNGINFNNCSVGAAKGSSGAEGGFGGSSSVGTGTTKTRGGDGGPVGAGTSGNCGAGGGAAYISAGGNGGNGGVGTPGLWVTGGGGGGGGGGNGSNATSSTGIGSVNGGGDGGSNASGTDGQTVAIFNSTHGPGGGGGGAGHTTAVTKGRNGGNGGKYGGGGGGGISGGVGGAGLIVITYTTLTPDTVTTVSGLDHLEGMTVQVVTDGSPHPDCVVSGGAITLNRSAYTVHVGLKYESILETSQLNQGAQDGTAQAKIKRVTWTTVRLLESKGGKIGPDADHLEEIRYRNANAQMDTYIPFFTGDKRIDFPGSFEGQSRIYVKQDIPFPFTLTALIPNYVTRERPGP